MSFVEVKNLAKSYSAQKVLNNISFEIEKGEFMGLVGPNGAGKTTLINIMMGLLSPDQGSVMIDGSSMQAKDLDLKQRIAYVPQELALFQDSSCYDNLVYFATLYNIFGAERKARAERALEIVGLSQDKDKKVKELSGGMARRLNIACAIMHEPEFLVLDEPTVGIDAQSRNFIFEYLEELNRQGITILYTSHYMEEIEKLCDRVFIIDRGEKVAFGEQDEIRALVEDTRKIDFAFSGPLSQEKIAELRNFSGVREIIIEGNEVQLEVVADEFSLNRAIQGLEADTEILSIDYRQISLEDVFLELTGRELRA